MKPGQPAPGAATLRWLAQWSAQTCLECLTIETPPARLRPACGARRGWRPQGTASLAASTCGMLLLEYDPVLNLWRTVATLPYPVAGAALVGDEVAVYLIGGWDGSEMRDDIWRYATDEPGSQEWVNGQL